jgi:predicted  nucleic acid-binding Zn-ribbon protein
MKKKPEGCDALITFYTLGSHGDNAAVKTVADDWGVRFYNLQHRVATWAKAGFIRKRPAAPTDGSTSSSSQEDLEGLEEIYEEEARLLRERVLVLEKEKKDLEGISSTAHGKIASLAADLDTVRSNHRQALGTARDLGEENVSLRKKLASVTKDWEKAEAGLRAQLAGALDKQKEMMDSFDLVGKQSAAYSVKLKEEVDRLTEALEQASRQPDPSSVFAELKATVQSAIKSKLLTEEEAAQRVLKVVMG